MTPAPMTAAARTGAAVLAYCLPIFFSACSLTKMPIRTRRPASAPFSRTVPPQGQARRRDRARPRPPAGRQRHARRDNAAGPAPRSPGRFSGGRRRPLLQADAARRARPAPLPFGGAGDGAAQLREGRLAQISGAATLSTAPCSSAACAVCEAPEIIHCAASARPIRRGRRAVPP